MYIFYQKIMIIVTMCYLFHFKKKENFNLCLNAFLTTQCSSPISYLLYHCSIAQ